MQQLSESLLILFIVVSGCSANLFGVVQPGVWTWISGNSESLGQDTEGDHVAMIDTSVASDESQFAYSFGGAQNLFTVANDYLIRYDPLNFSSPRKIYGSNRFFSNSDSLPQIVTNPPARHGASLWYATASKSLYLFSGYMVQGRCASNDFWKFNNSDLSWTLLGGTLNCSTRSERLPKYGVRKEFNSLNWPGSRYHSAYWTNNRQNKLYFYGGSGGYQGSSFDQFRQDYISPGNDVWCYDLRTLQWAWIAGSSTSVGSIAAQSTDAIPPENRTPGGVSNPTFGSLTDGNLWMLGYGSSSSFFLWMYDVDLSIWIRKSQIQLSNTPNFRISGKIMPVGENHLILISGLSHVDAGYKFSDTWTFSLGQSSWNWISGNSEAVAFTGWSNTVKFQSTPLSTYPLQLFGAVNSPKHIFLFGGFWDSTITNVAIRYSICPLNQFIANNTCVDCDRNFIGSLTSVDSCSPSCPIPGTVSDGVNCIGCSAGRYASANQSCLACASGKYSFQAQNPECSFCPEGKYSPGVNFSYCLSCESGKYTSTSGNSFCTTCPAGRYSSAGSFECFSCPIGTFGDSALGCKPCIRNATTVSIGSSSSSSCVCSSGFYGNAYEASGECILCKNEAAFSCPQNSSIPSLAAGYYRNPLDVNSAYVCIPKQACLPTESFQKETPCAEGYLGFLCGKCVPLEYYKQGPVCSKCPTKASIAITYVIVLLALISVIWKLVKILESKSGMIDVRILVFWSQIIAIYPSLSTTWPSVLNSAFQILSFLNFDFDITSPECSFKVSFWNKLFVKLVSPMILVLLYMLFWGLNVVRNGDKITFLDVLRKFGFIFVVVGSVFYTIIFSTLISPFNCKAQSDGSYSLWNDSSITCYSPEWNSQIYIVYIFFALYVGCFFGYIFYEYAFYRFSKSEEITETFLYLTNSYKKSTYWWELIYLIKKVCLIVVGFLFSEEQGSRYFVMIILLVIFLVLDIFAHPFQRKFLLKISLVWNSVSLLLLMADGLIFKSNTISQREKDLCAIGMIAAVCAAFILTLGYIIRSKVFVTQVKEVVDVKHIELDKELYYAAFTPSDSFKKAYSSDTDFSSSKMKLIWKGTSKIGFGNLIRSTVDNTSHPNVLKALKKKTTAKKTEPVAINLA